MKLKTLVISAVVVMVGLPVAVFVPYYNMTQNTFEATISYQKPSKDGQYNLVGLADDPFDWGEIRNDDEALILKWDSGRLGGKLIPGKKCTMTTYGWRFGLMSLRPNLIEVGKCD